MFIVIQILGTDDRWNYTTVCSRACEITFFSRKNVTFLVECVTLHPHYIWNRFQLQFMYDFYLFILQSVIQMGGFRSLGDDEEVEFKAVKSDKGLEAVEVRSSAGGDCKGSNRRPGAKKKHKKVRYQS